LASPAETPEVVRSFAAFEDDAAQPTEPFNPNRARGSAGRPVQGTPVSRPVNAVPPRPAPRPPQPEQFARPALPPTTQPSLNPPTLRPLPATPQTVELSEPAPRPPLPRGQHLTQTEHVANEGLGVEPRHPNLPGSQPTFDSFPIVESGGAPLRRPVAQTSLPQQQV